jgi:hypothetical protein
MEDSSILLVDCPAAKNWYSLFLFIAFSLLLGDGKQPVFSD